MSEIKGHRFLPLLGIIVSFTVLLLEFPRDGWSQETNDPKAAQRVKEENDKPQTPRGQTFYKWRDEKGNLFFTDDLAKVPEAFRNELETLELPHVPEEEGISPRREQAPVEDKSPSPALSHAKEVVAEPEKRHEASPAPFAYKEVPFSKFIHITIGMDEAEVLSRLGPPSLVTPSDYFYGERVRYKYRIIRLIYLGNRDLKQKTTVVEIRNGRVIDIERIYPF